MALLNKQQILEANDLPTQDVPVPEWGGTVRVRGLDGEASTKFSAGMVKLNSQGEVESVAMDNFMAKLVSITVINENGQLLFSEADVNALGRKSAKALKRVSDVASELSGIEAKKNQDVAKNSAGTPAGVSLTV